MFYIFLLIILVFGLCIGSFLNVVILRLETSESLGGRSHCPHCKHNLIWKDLIPVASFLILQGKCRYCAGKISWQYPIIEIATAMVFLLIAIHQTSAINYIFLCYVASALIIIFVYDIKHYIIPDKILFPAIIIIFAYRIFEGSLYGDFITSRIWEMGNYILAALIASGFFLIIFMISKGRWMGFGDVKLAIIMGLLLGVPDIFVALIASFWLGAIVGLLMMFLQKRKIKSELPFAPFLISGTFMALFWGSQIISWYGHYML